MKIWLIEKVWGSYYETQVEQLFAVSTIEQANATVEKLTRLDEYVQVVRIELRRWEEHYEVDEKYQHTHEKALHKQVGNRNAGNAKLFREVKRQDNLDRVRRAQEAKEAWMAEHFNPPEDLKELIEYYDPLVYEYNVRFCHSEIELV